MKAQPRSMAAALVAASQHNGKVHSGNGVKTAVLGSTISLTFVEQYDDHYAQTAFITKLAMLGKNIG